MSDLQEINDRGEDSAAERAAVHRMVATLDELMGALKAKGVLDRDDLNAIERAVADRLGEPARVW